MRVYSCRHPGCGREIRLIDGGQPPPCPSTPGATCDPPTDGERMVRELARLSDPRTPRRPMRPRKIRGGSH
jgi:hypothetical protein